MKTLNMQRVSLDHRGGTKSYHLAAIVCRENGKSILMKRWGRTGQFGQVQIQQFAGANEAIVELQKIQRAKSAKGYEVVTQKADQAPAVDTQGFFGLPVFAAFGAENLEFLNAGIDTKGLRRSSPHATVDENGNFLGSKPARHVEVDQAALAREELARKEAEQAKNPMFGLF